MIISTPISGENAKTMKQIAKQIGKIKKLERRCLFAALCMGSDIPAES